MATVIEERKEQIRDLVCEILEIEPTDLGDDDDFKEAHGADSMATIELLGALEMRYKVSIDQSQLPTMGTFNGVYDAVAKAAGWE